jgi:anaerobic selenocysteine-containing dehydrogenase
MGFEETCFRESVDDMIDKALASGHEFLAGINRQRLEQEPHVRLNLSSAGSAAVAAVAGGHLGAQQSTASSGTVPCAPSRSTTLTGVPHPFLPHATGNFETPSGKAEFYSERLAQSGLDAVVRFTPPAESRHVPLHHRYPLDLLARKADNYVNSTFANLESHRKLERVRTGKMTAACGPERSEAQSRELAFPGTPLTVDTLEINSTDAISRGLRNGDTVRVFNDRGEVHLTALVKGSVQPGVVAARLNWAKLSEGGKNINVLTSDRLTDMGGSPAFYSVLVEVEKIKP